MTTDGRRPIQNNPVAMCHGKDGMTPEQARKVAKRMQRHDKIVEAYRCPICNHWHVGSSKNIRAPKVQAEW